MSLLSSASGYATLSAMITPALFMTANGSLIISTSNRVSRIVDRIRVLNDQADKLDRGQTDLDYPVERRDHFASQLDSLEWRSDRVRLALTLHYLSLSAFVGTSLVLAADVLLGSRLKGAPTMLAVVGVVLMLLSCISLTLEARRALQSNRQEVRFHRELQARRRADRASPQSPRDV